MSALLIIVAVFVLVIIAAVAFIIYRSTAAEDPGLTYDELANKYGGTYTLGGQFNNDYLSLPYKGSDLNVTYYSGNRGSISGFSAKLETSVPHLGEALLWASSSRKNASESREGQVLTGDEKFDDVFLVRSQDVSFVKRVFNEKVRQAILQKYGKRKFYMLRVDLTETTFNLFARVSKYRVSYYEDVVEIAMSILGAAWN